MDLPQSDTEPDSSLSDSDIVAPQRNNRTHIHAFALEGDGTRYLASGAINGTLRDRWSLDEYDGHLRVAVSWHNRGGAARENGIVVLDEQDGRLEQVGELRGLGVDEEIQSVRWFDDLAVVVTFRQMDPLYTIDLSDPTSPRRLGRAEDPGLLLLPAPHRRRPPARPRHRRRPRRTDPGRPGSGVRHQRPEPGPSGRQGDLRRTATLAASEDPHAFTWLPDANAAITSLAELGHPGLRRDRSRASRAGHRAEPGPDRAGGADRRHRDGPAPGLPARGRCPRSGSPRRVAGSRGPFRSTVTGSPWSASTVKIVSVD